MFVEEPHIPAVFGNSTEKNQMESDQASTEAILRNLYTQLFGSRILRRGTASVEMPCEQAIRHVETIHSTYKTLEGSPKNLALWTAAVVSTVHLLGYHRKILDGSIYYCKLHIKG